MVRRSPQQRRSPRQRRSPQQHTHDTRLETARNAQSKMRRIVRQAGLSPENCRRVQSACVHAAALFAAELWWKGDGIYGTQTHQEDLQKLVSQEARHTTGAFRTTNQGALNMESGLHPAATRLDNGLRRFALGSPASQRGTRHENLPEQIARSETGCSLPLDAGTERKKRSFWR